MEIKYIISIFILILITANTATADSIGVISTNPTKPVKGEQFSLIVPVSGNQCKWVQVSEGGTNWPATLTATTPVNVVSGTAKIGITLNDLNTHTLTVKAYKQKNDDIEPAAKDETYEITALPVIGTISTNPSQPIKGEAFSLIVPVNGISEWVQVSEGGTNWPATLTKNINNEKATIDVILNDLNIHTFTIKAYKPDNQGQPILEDTTTYQKVAISSTTQSEETFFIDVINDQYIQGKATIKVTYVPSTGTLIFEDQNKVLNQGIVDIAYNLADVTPISATGKVLTNTNPVQYRDVNIYSNTNQIQWSSKTQEKENGKNSLNSAPGFAQGVFGSFTNSYGGNSGGNPTDTHRYNIVIVQFDKTDVSLTENKLKNLVAVHYVFYDGKSCYISGYKPPTPPNPSIPEFPSIALPVASIIGLMFVLGRRKNK